MLNIGFDSPSWLTAYRGMRTYEMNKNVRMKLLRITLQIIFSLVPYRQRDLDIPTTVLLQNAGCRTVANFVERSLVFVLSVRIYRFW